ncbi:acetylxylan esterase [Echinimonas agarilytica]|uniref:Acetylxylan esterase n=1 Tax=Echinimonas agarilytica TaxID=1215918 RepID=A0AA41W7D0_9GAMM|nr:acetylxylan esterase [Echinimonas agarilytica]MCM2680056.1 acetylxylan esterase [Echinimonas agarilytica]
MKDFDPSYGYSKEQLLCVPAPQEPDGFLEFWQRRYEAVLGKPLHEKVRNTGEVRDGFQIHEFSFISTNDITIKGWLLVPDGREIKRGFIVGHGYGGCDGPDTTLPFPDAAMLFLCFRGLGRSGHDKISSQSFWHVLHNIQDYQRYVIGGCVEDFWLSISLMLKLFPELSGHLGLMGISFSGGLAALALAVEQRIQSGHVNVPTFGNYQVRLQLPTKGSGFSVQRFHKRHPEVTNKTLAFHDAAIAAKYIRVPMHFACAKSDPIVAPPGQFAIYNATVSSKQLYWLSHGHAEYPEQEQEHQQLLAQLMQFFKHL